MSGLPDNFSDYPESLATARAHSESDARLWTPRDALLEVLKDIDSGVANPTQIIIVYEQDPPEGKQQDTTYVAAGVRNCKDALGLLEYAKLSVARTEAGYESD